MAASVIVAATAVSTVTTSAPDAELTFPAPSAAVAVMLWLPTSKVELVIDQFPLPSAVATPICAAPSNSLTVPPASESPVKWVS